MCGAVAEHSDQLSHGAGQNSHCRRRLNGGADGLVNLVSPTQRGEAPVTVKVWTCEPIEDDRKWDNVVDVDLDLPDGVLSFEPSGGETSRSAARCGPGTTGHG